MSNPLSVRRVMVQTLNEKGEPDGEPTFGVIASDDYKTKINDTFDSFKELNDEIEKTGCITDIVEFHNVNREVVGTDNYYGKDWEEDRKDD